ncbi:hypothetical protein THIOKS12000057 [Thiocapsa sp. KS1]|nr:hypothetical protein THIOKS12000057 [Thiocapsa sp. KS1]
MQAWTVLLDALQAATEARENVVVGRFAKSAPDWQGDSATRRIHDSGRGRKHQATKTIEGERGEPVAAVCVERQRRDRCQPGAAPRVSINPNPEP